MRASTSAAWLQAGSVLCALITTRPRRAGARAAAGPGGSRSAPPTRRRRRAGRRARGRPAASPATSPTVPTYDGSPTSTARASGCARSASATVAGATPSGSPVAGSTSGRTHTGSSPARTRPSSIDRCSVRLTTTRSPSRAERQGDRLVGVGRAADREPATSAPHSRAARASASAQHAARQLHGVQAGVQRDVAGDHVADQVVALLVPGDRERRRAPPRGTAARRPAAARRRAGPAGRSAPGHASRAVRVTTHGFAWLGSFGDPPAAGRDLGRRRRGPLRHPGRGHVRPRGAGADGRPAGGAGRRRAGARAGHRDRPGRRTARRARRVGDRHRAVGADGGPAAREGGRGRASRS